MVAEPLIDTFLVVIYSVTAVFAYLAASELAGDIGGAMRTVSYGFITIAAVYMVITLHLAGVPLGERSVEYLHEFGEVLAYGLMFYGFWDLRQTIGGGA